MSSFSFLNQSPDIEQLEAEEHTRETQIELCFQLFQDALERLKDDKFGDANDLFEKLMSQEVIKPDKWGLYAYSSSIVDNLRYLAYRNRGFFYYKFLMNQYSESMSSEDVVDNILKIVENLLESLRHSEADYNVIEVLVQIFESFKSKRLQKLLLENEFMNNDSHLLFSGRKRTNILPQLKVLISQYINLLKDLHASSVLEKKIICNGQAKNTSHLPRTNVKFKNILEQLNKLRTEDDELIKSLDIHDIELDNYDWTSLLRSLRETLPTVKSLALFGRNSDPYAETETPIEAVKVIVKEEVVIDKIHDNSNNENEVTEEKEITDNKVVTTNGNNRKRSITEIETKHAQRSSKRFRDRDSSAADSETPMTFEPMFYSYTKILSLLGCKAPYDYEAIYPDLMEVKANDIIYADFLACLKEWSHWHTDCLSSQNEKEIKTKKVESSTDVSLSHFKTLLNSKNFQKSDDHIPEISQTSLRRFLDKVNKQQCHFHELRFKLIWFLFDNQNGDRLLTSTRWTKQMYRDVEWITLSIEKNIFSFIQSDIAKYRHVALSIFETLINSLVELCEEINSKLSLGQKANDQKTQKVKIEKKITKWNSIIAQVETTDRDWTVRYLWAYYTLIQCTSDIQNCLLSNILEKVHQILMKDNSSTVYLYPNADFISSFDLSFVDTQLKKLKMIKKLVNVDKHSESVKSEDNNSQFIMLENVLLSTISENHAVGGDDDDMIDFFMSAPFMLKFKLWELIYMKYVKKNDIEKTTLIYGIMLKLLVDTLECKTYRTLGPKKRQERLLIMMSCLKDITHNCIEVLKNNAWLQKKLSWYDDTTSQLVFIFFILFPMLPVNAPNKLSGTQTFFQKATKSSKTIKSIFVDILTLLLFHLNIGLKSKISSEPELENSIIDLVSTTHISISFYNFCDYASGNFLQIAENLICQFTNEEAFTQLKQIMWCKYHYQLSGDSSIVSQHKTKAMEMSKMVSLPLGIYLVKLQYQDKHPYINSAKIASKQILDNIVETFGDLSSQDNYIIMRNLHAFNGYLRSNITSKLFQSCFEGKDKVDLKNPNDEFQKAMDAGVFYVSGIQALNLYKIRKRSVQARPSELDAIITMFKNDILYNTKRFESWYLLGKCYSYIVEDDLLWTADKISSSEKKAVIATTQKRAILCYAMSLTLFFENETTRTVDEQIVIVECLESLANELMIAVYKPMEALCFDTNLSSLVVSSSNPATSSEIEKSSVAPVYSITDSSIEDTMIKCLTLANRYQESLLEAGKLDRLNWFNFYSIAIVYSTEKLDRKGDMIDNMSKACELANKYTSVKDSVVEPHVALIHMLYKLYIEGKVTMEDTLSTLKRDKFFEGFDDDFWILDVSLTQDYQKREFFSKLIELLKYVISKDKKKWQHEPYFYIAEILFMEMKDVEKSREWMDNIISIRSVNKNLVNIWKPDYERPGKHFVFTHNYVMFYLELLKYDKDAQSIGLLTKKLRRFSSGMAYIGKANDVATSYFIECVTKKYLLHDKVYTESYMGNINYNDFVKYSQEIVDNSKAADIAEDILEVLKIAYQLKKGTNSVVYDTVCLSLFFQYIYEPYRKEHPETEPQLVSDCENKSNIRKKVSKKDAFDKIRALVDKLP